MPARSEDFSVRLHWLSEDCIQDMYIRLTTGIMCKNSASQLVAFRGLGPSEAGRGRHRRCYTHTHRENAFSER